MSKAANGSALAVKAGKGDGTGEVGRQRALLKAGSLQHAIITSANAVRRDIERALEAGFFNYLTKPIKVNQFMDALDVALKFAQTGAHTTAGRTTQEEQAS